EPQRGQAKGDAAASVEVVSPGVGLPDAQVLLADGDVARQPIGVGPNELRERIERRASVARHPFVNLRPTAMRIGTPGTGGCESSGSVAKPPGAVKQLVQNDRDLRRSAPR